jgi:hypothetical protein
MFSNIVVYVSSRRPVWHRQILLNIHSWRYLARHIVLIERVPQKPKPALVDGSLGFPANLPSISSLEPVLAYTPRPLHAKKLAWPDGRFFKNVSRKCQDPPSIAALCGFTPAQLFPLNSLLDVTENFLNFGQQRSVLIFEQENAWNLKQVHVVVTQDTEI